MSPPLQGKPEQAQEQAGRRTEQPGMILRNLGFKVNVVKPDALGGRIFLRAGPFSVGKAEAVDDIRAVGDVDAALTAEVIGNISAGDCLVGAASGHGIIAGVVPGNGRCDQGAVCAGGGYAVYLVYKVLIGVCPFGVRRSSIDIKQGEIDITHAIGVVEGDGHRDGLVILGEVHIKIQLVWSWRDAARETLGDLRIAGAEKTAGITTDGDGDVVSRIAGIDVVRIAERTGRPRDVAPVQHKRLHL